MSRYIDADALIKQLKSSSAYNDYEWAMYADGFIEDIENAPSIDIVRCKECKHYDKFRSWSACTYWSGDPYEQASVNADDFCSYGEREGE